MPQTAQQVAIFQQAGSNVNVLETAAKSTHLNITAATVVKATPGTAVIVNVLVVGTGTGTINDCATTGAVATANEVFVIPEAVGSYPVHFPCAVGIVVTPGTGQTLAVSYN